jgi:hypothetical protein
MQRRSDGEENNMDAKVGTHASEGSTPELTDGGFEMLQVAVRLARDKQVPSVKALRDRLQAMFTGRADDIEQALRYWSARLKVVGVCD